MDVVAGSQGPSGKDPWTTLRPPDRFPACLGLEKQLFGINSVKISRSRSWASSCTAKRQRRPKSHNQNFEIANFRNHKFSIFPKLLLSDRGASRAWLDVRKHIPNTRPRARAPRAPLPLLDCMTLSWQSTPARERQGISNFRKSQNPQNLEIRKISEFPKCGF